jgi:signal transduction histidine kinase
VITQSGKIKWIRDSSRYFPSGTDGDVIVDGVILDISDVYDELYLRKQAELALRENQRLLQQIADTTLTMIYIFDLCEQRDEKLLHFILTNLLSNAIKCSPEGGEVNLTLIYQENETIFSSPKLWNWHSSGVSATAF